MFIGIGRLQLSVDLTVEADDAALSGISDQPHLAALARLEARRRPGRDIEPVAARQFAIEGECGVRFVEMIMRADLDRPIAGIGDGQGHRRSADVDLDLVRRGEELSRDHPTTLLTYLALSKGAVEGGRQDAGRWPLRTGDLAVFAVSAGNYQRATSASPQKFWSAGSAATKKTAGFAPRVRSSASKSTPPPPCLHAAVCDRRQACTRTPPIMSYRL